jgi:hypothetical protein
MPVPTDETFVAESAQLERGRRVIDVVGHILAAGMQLENRFKAVLRTRIGFFDEGLR